MAVERVDIAGTGPPWAAEHLARYRFALQFVRGAEVLDLACGTGEGARFLLEDGGADRVVAADLSDEAIASSREVLAPFGARAEVRREDGCAMTFPEGAFDVITSFETIEHVSAPERFLSECGRVLRSGGRLVLSTPNALVTNPEGGTPANPFHVREFTPAELAEMVGAVMDVEVHLGQHVPPRYGVAPFLPSFRPEALSFGDRLNFAYWRLMLRLKPVRGPVHRLLTGVDFYPAADDYVFEASLLESAHVQVIVAARR